MNTTTKAPRDRAMLAIQIVIWAFLIGAAWISFTHIVEACHMLGLNEQSYAAPFFVDGIAIVGKISMLPRFTKAFRDSGFKLLMFGGVLSLACNVGAGSNWGERAFGVLIVAGFMVLENHATKAGKQAVAETVDPAEAARAQALAEAEAQQAAADAVKRAERRERDRERRAAKRDELRAEAKLAEQKREERRLRDAERRAARRLAEIAPESPIGPAVILSADDKAVLAEYMTR